MSYSVPGPERDDSIFRIRRKQEPSVVAQARQTAEQLFGQPPREDKDIVSPPPGRADEMKAVAGPPVLDRLLQHEELRSAARASGDTDLANRALMQVVGDLNQLLDSAESHLRQSERRRTRQRVQKAVPQFIAMSGVAALPLGDVAEFLDLPPEQVHEVLGALARYGGISATERREALEHVARLRAQLRQVAATANHSLLDRILRFVAKLAIVVAVTLASTLVGDVVVNGAVLTDIVKAAVTALVAAALQQIAIPLSARHNSRDPHTVARGAHDGLIAALSKGYVLRDEPAYEGEHAVIRVNLGIRCCLARIASIQLDWNDKARYWDLLDQITDALTTDSPAALAALQRRISALNPPAG